MTKRQRWIKSTIAAAEACTTQMPWERGARRQEMIARRMEDREVAKITLAPLPAWMTESLSA